MTTFTTSDGVDIYYKDWGIGKPVLFSHGWPLSADMWDAQMLFFAQNGYRVIAFDRRGFGRSDQPWDGYNYDRFADDIAELIEKLDLHEVTLVGFSMGGGDVSRYIARHGNDRVAKLALLGAVTPIFRKTEDHPIGPDDAVFEGIRNALVQDRPQFFKDFWPAFYGINHGAKVSDGVLNQTLQIALQASLKATIDCVTAFSETDFRPDMGKINVPTLIIHGDDDQVVPFEATGALAAKMISNATLKIYPGAPHGFIVTHQEELFQDLHAFLKA
ncbi:alpha/beta fold hydrolase [Gluconobacter wancherniae]|uniref:Arylesterase n=1 Tax=Gluconobacter wancherniae NBRC 103581 TaxID=656744 RepID=A0A511AY76_9PROT|nr:alpha/beta hydrolase [Gluconobacter wancherniae]MBF0853288.1 alpha/beta hydrolase [Gluconobacter wancherniae]GBD55981.1 arylesterase [Gluconobacter wancherniae NBRC 103581]GBR62966.1 non-heme chloroperoxidase [Gluconobacter wancherniae NBRC 103581]GEK93116.1 arylesterase [Gluconobacter wancherniae NBRC 103581]